MMRAKQLETITGQLDKLHGYAYFRPEAGPLRERLAQSALEELEGEYAELLSGGAFDLEVNIGGQEGEGELTLGFRIDHPALHHSSQLSLELLSVPELEDLARHLERLSEQPAAAPVAAEPGKTIVRKKPVDDAEHHEKVAAAARLKVSPEWLKSVVPCTDYSYDEIDGKKYIREYYWSKELIERLVKIKSTKTTPEDLQFVAAECCHGDLDWARDLIARLKSPNRPEPAAKVQQQKAEGKQGHSKPGAAKPLPGKGMQARPQAKQGAAKGAPAQPQTQAESGQAQAAPGERSRRSRHRRPFRRQGGEGGRTPQNPAGDKPPQQ